MSQTASAHTDGPLLCVRDLEVTYRRRGHGTPALSGVSLEVFAGETVGVVGESGSGKTTLGRAILGQVPVGSGAIEFGGRDITAASVKQRRLLARELQVVFQDPYSSLNPTRTIGQSVAQPLVARKGLDRAAIREQVGKALERVGLPGETAHRYPAEFSGGQRQRIAIARAIIGSPRLIVCDEPVSALDLSVQAQVLNLLQDLQRELRLSLLFIAHDLEVVRHISRRIVVLYRGHIAEEGAAQAVYRHAVHPYTQALLRASPIPDARLQRQRRAERQSGPRRHQGSLPADGCPYAPRCPIAVPDCTAAMPPLSDVAPDHKAACIRAGAVPTAGVTRPRMGATPP